MPQLQTFFRINSKKVQIGIGLGKFSLFNLEELQICKIIGGFLGGGGVRIGVSNESKKNLQIGIGVGKFSQN